MKKNAKKRSAISELLVEMADRFDSIEQAHFKIDHITKILETRLADLESLKKSVTTEVGAWTEFRKLTVRQVNGTDRVVMSHQRRLDALEEWQAFIDPTSAARRQPA